MTARELSELRYVVLVDRGPMPGSEPIAAFNCESPALAYARDCSRANLGRVYTVTELRPTADPPPPMKLMELVNGAETWRRKP